MAPTARDYLGTGWAFPLRVTPNGRIATARAQDRVEDSVYLILGTALGERVMRPAFGCGLADLVFEPGGPPLAERVVPLVRQALVRDEPRIDVLDVSAEAPPDAPTLLLIRVSYRIRQTNSRGNVVYPFYAQES